MSNVLDLKNTQPEQGDASGTTDVQRPPAPVEPASGEPDASLDAESLAEAALAAAELPASVAWEAHHPLQGYARWRHFVFLGGLVALGAILSLWQRSPVTFIVMLVAAAALELRERFSEPVSVAIDESGVVVDGAQYEHAAFASFHIHRMPDDTLELSLRSQQRLLPHLRLPLGDQDPYEVHAVLAQYVPEGQHKIPIVDYLIRKPR